MTEERERLVELMKAAIVAAKDELVAVYGRDAGMFDVMGSYARAALDALEAELLLPEAVERGARALPVLWPYDDPPFSPETSEAAREDLRNAVRRAVPALLASAPAKVAEAESA